MIATPTALLVAMTLFKVTSGQYEIMPPIPVLPREPGTRHNPETVGAKVKVEAIVEVHCADSAAAWPILKEVAEHYGPANVDLVVHMFPLPYHRWSFVATQGFYLIKDKLPGQELDYLTAMFEHWQEFSSSATEDLSHNEILTMLSELAQETTGISANEFVDQIDNYFTETVYSWKYACRRGAAGTPWFYVNGVDLTVNPSVMLTFDDWTTFLDPLVGDGGTTTPGSTTPGSTTPDMSGGAAAANGLGGHRTLLAQAAIMEVMRRANNH